MNRSQRLIAIHWNELNAAEASSSSGLVQFAPLLSIKKRLHLLWSVRAAL